MSVAPARSTRTWMLWLLLSSAGVGYATYDLILWLIAWYTGHGDFHAAQSAFAAHMLFATLRQESVAALACAGLGVASAVPLLHRSQDRRRRVAQALAVVGTSLVAWNLWTLM